MKPRNIGPAGMSGRVTAIDAVWTNPNIIYLGTASGGVWKTENGGASWESIFDDQPILNIGAVANDNAIDVAAQHRVAPYRGMASNLDVTYNLGRLMNIRAIRKHRMGI